LSWLTSRIRGLLSQNHRSPNDGPGSVARVYDLIRYRFVNQALLTQALKHRSYLPFVNEERVESNERLELLGDAVLGLVVTEYLYRRYPYKEEGELTSMKSLMVSRKILAALARQMGLGDLVLISQSEERSGGRRRSSILADCFEALIGAIYLDGGLASARAVIHSQLLEQMDEIFGQEQHRNYKSLLLEYAQGRSLGSPVYAVVSEHGPDHDKIFTVEVRIMNEIVGRGSGNSKKKAEQQAARAALEKLMVI
jgi:ribonuclease-3